MKNILKIISYATIILFIGFGCCKKNNTSPNFLKGNVKRIQETLIVPNKNYYYDLHFFYDSIDGELQKITLNNKLYVEISKKIDNYFILDYDVSVRDSTTTPNRVKIKAYIDNNGYINKMVYVDSTLSQLQELLDIYTTNGYPDSIREFFLESKYYNFQFINDNISHSVHDYTDFFSQNYRTTMDYTYINKMNKNKLPFQNDVFIFYAVGYSTYSTNPLYLLGLNGYHTFKGNANLIDSIKNIENNLHTKYEYVSNSFDDIIKMKIYKDTTNYSNYDIEYY